MSSEQTTREKASAAYNVYAREVIREGGVPQSFEAYLADYGWDVDEIEDEPTVPHCEVCAERGEEHIPEGWE